MFKIVTKIFAAVIAGSLNALRGSGKLKEKNKFLDIVQWTLKRIIVPIVLAIPTWYLSKDLYITIASLLPYYWKMFTGTGGDMQARTDNKVCNLDNAQEFKPFDYLAKKLAELNAFTLNYCQQWGIWYCTLTAVVYSLPFILTNYLYALPLFIYPAFVRYSNWRLVEFGYLALFQYLLLQSI